MLIGTLGFVDISFAVTAFHVDGKKFLYLNRSDNSNIIHGVEEKDCDEYFAVLALAEKRDFPAARALADKHSEGEDSPLQYHMVDVSCFELTGNVPEPIKDLGYKQKITSTDCRTPVGVTVGLIDGIIAMARVIRNADISSDEVQEALKDLRADEDMAFLMGLALTAKEIDAIRQLIK